MPLNPKQAKFVAEYLKDSNASRAARAAGYSSKNADVVGPRLLGTVGIRAAIDKALGKVERTADDYLKRIDTIAFGDPETEGFKFRSNDVTAMLALGAKVRGMVREKLEVSGTVKLEDLVPAAVKR